MDSRLFFNVLLYLYINFWRFRKRFVKIYKFTEICLYICYNNKTQIVINNTIYHKLLNIPKMDGEYIYGKNDLFALIIILKRILNADDFNLFIKEIDYELDILSGKLHSIDIDKVLDSMGFPINYREIERMD